MSYLNLDPNYFSNPKTLRLVGVLGKGAETYPIRLWCHCAKHHPTNGILKGYSESEVEAVVGWDGNPGDLVKGLLKVGFIDKKENHYVLHDWKEHEGHIIAFKIRSTKANKARWGKINKTPLRNPKEYNKESYMESPLPYLTLPNQLIKKEEKESVKEKEENALSRERVDEIKAKLKAFYDLCPYLQMTRRDNADLQLLAMNIPSDLWEEWLPEIYKNRPLKDTFDYWAGSLRARIHELDGKALKDEARGDKRLLGEILKGIGNG